MSHIFKELAYIAKWGVGRRGAFTHDKFLRNNERLPLCEIENLQTIRLVDIVKHAYEYIPYYGAKYRKAGFNLMDIGYGDWFENLPIITKQELRDHFEDIIDQRYRRYMHVSTTGGSTGVPTKTGYDRRIPEEAYSWRLQRWFGVNPWDDHAYVWRDTRSGKIAKLKNALLWWPTRHLKMDATFITEDGMSDFIKKYNRLKPAMLQGYVGAITQLAQFIVDKRLRVYSPKFVWTTSAPLPSSQRNLISQAFGAPVCDQYGSCEVRWIAAQCPECGGLHVNAEHVRIEFVDDGNQPVARGEYGRTLLTNLEDKVFPLIRYENGDRGRWLNGQCPCGRTLPMIDSVKGRESESFVLPSGKTLNGEFLTTIFDSDPDLVSGFRVVQHKDLNITIEYIPAGDEQDILMLIQSFATKVGDDVRVDSRSVGSIPHDRGKLRYVVKE